MKSIVKLLIVFLLLSHIAAAEGATSPDGKYRYSVIGWDVVVTDTTTQETVGVYKGMYYGGITVDSAGNVYVANVDRIDILNVEKDRRSPDNPIIMYYTQGSIPVAGYNPSGPTPPLSHGLVISPDGSKIYTTSPGELFVVDVATKSVVKTVNVDNPEYYMTLSVSSDGSKIYTSQSVVDSSTYEVSQAGESIPEFPTIGFPIAAVLGLILIFGRKK